MRAVSAVSRLSALLPFLATCTAACASTSTGLPPDPTPLIQPGAPGEASRTIDTADAVALSRSRFTDADVRFMQNMIAHHAQAIEMTRLIDSHTRREDLRLLGRRIELSQADEIDLMQQWLSTRGQQIPEGHVHALMPGMLTPDELDRLSRAKDSEFDRLFLEGMIRHHAGALVMVQELFNSPGAGEDSDIFAFASDVDVDQRIEIARMGALLTELEK